MENDKLLPNANWQTQYRGSDNAEYEIYKSFAEDLGWKVKSYEEWSKS